MTTSEKLFLKVLLYSLGGAALSGALARWLGDYKRMGTDVLSGIAILCLLLAFITLVAFLVSFVVSGNRGPSSELIKPLPDSSTIHKKADRLTKQRGKR